MEEIISSLQDAHIEQTVPLDLPEIEDLVEIEEIILLPLPSELRQFLMTVSDVVCGHIEPVTVMDERSHTYLPEVTAQAWQEGMSREWIVVCAYCDGYAYIQQDGEMGFWQPEWANQTMKSNQQWDSIWHWAQSEWLP